MFKRINKVSKKVVEEIIREELKKHREILFAYLHSSFVKKDTFRDIDVAIYIEKMSVSILEYELEMETELMKVLKKYIVDVRVLNTAPLSFKYNVLKEGKELLVKDNDKRVDFEEKTIVFYLDFLPYLNLYLKETLNVEI